MRGRHKKEKKKNGDCDVAMDFLSFCPGFKPRIEVSDNPCERKEKKKKKKKKQFHDCLEKGSNT